MKTSVLLTTLAVAVLSIGQVLGQETLIKRINCGGQAVTGDDGQFYEADASNGDVSFSSDSDALTHLSWVSPPLNEPYISSRLISRHVGTEFEYTFSNLTAATQYRLVMHFAEPYHGVVNSNWNTRVFDIDINNGEHFINDYNIMTEAAAQLSPSSSDPLDGAKEVAILERVVNLTGTSLVIQFTNVSNDALVNAIELYRIDGAQDNDAPTVPGGLTSTAQGETNIDLSWSASNDDTAVTGYKVFQGGSTIATLGNVTNYQVTGLNADTNYTFSVSAFDAAGNESAASAAITLSTASGASGGGGSGSSGGWTVGSGIVHYNDQVAVGTQSVPNQYLMAVDGKLITEEVRVELSDSNGNWPDYVFTDAHELPTLAELKKHIDSKGHLPKIPSAQEVAANGIELGEMNRLLLEKIEELTLYLLKQEERLNKQQIEIEKLKKKHQ